MAKTQLITQHFGYLLAKCKDYLSLLSPIINWRWARGWEGAKPGQVSSADGGSISCHRTLCSAVKIWGEGKGEINGFMAFVLPSNHELSLYQCISLAFLLFLPSPTGEWNKQEAVWVFGSWPGSTNISFQEQLFLDVSGCQGKMTHQLPILQSLRCNLDILFWLTALLYLSIEKFSDRSSFQYCCCYCYVSWYIWRNGGQASYYFLTWGSKCKARALSHTSGPDAQSHRLWGDRRSPCDPTMGH